MRLAFAALGLLLCLTAPARDARAQDSLAQLYAEAQRAQSAGDLATATQKYEAIVKLRPEMAEAFANLGNLYYQQGKNDNARDAYEKALRLKPGLAGPHFFLGVIAFGAHDYAAALKHLRQADSLQPSNAQILAHLGYTEYALSHYREAAAEFEKAQALDPSNIDVLYHLSKSYGQLAKAAFLQLKKQFPDSPYTALARAQAAEAGESWKDAAEQYSRALRKMPGNARLAAKARWAAAKLENPSTPPDSGAPDALIDASLLYKDVQRTGEALKTETARFRDHVHEAAGTPAGDKHIYIEAESYQVLSYLTSLAVFELDPDSYRSHQLHAQLLEASNKDDEAIAEYRNVLKRNPDVQNIHFAIGTLYWKNQKLPEARGELEAELKLNPSHPDALYELGDIAAFSGDSQTAEKYFRAALKLRPSLIEAHYGLEKICTQDGRFDEALAHLRKVLEIDPSEATAHYRLAAVYRKMGRAADAEKELAIFNRTRQ